MRFNKDSFEFFISVSLYMFFDFDEVYVFNIVRILVCLYVFVLRLGFGCYFVLFLIYIDGK